jgi:hypothetical protein
LKKVTEMANPNHDPKTGEFSSGGGGGTKGREPGGYQFFSANEEENLSFEEASARALGSEAQQRMLATSKEIDQRVGLHSTALSAIGDWSDGAENSVFNVTKEGDFDKLEYSAALKGDLANQKSVIAFSRGEGPDTIYRMDLPGKLSDIRANLDKAGLQFRTLVPTATGAHVVLFDPGSSLADNVQKLGDHYEDLTVKSARGTGKFIGGDTREEGHAAYGKVISAYEQSHNSGGSGGLGRSADSRRGPSSAEIKSAVKDALGSALAAPELQRGLRKLGRKP